MNISVSSTTKTTPYEVVFGQHPRSSIALIENLSSQGIENEEDLPIEIQNSINEHADHPQCLAVDDRSKSSENDTEPTDKGMYCYITHLKKTGVTKFVLVISVTVYNGFE